MSAEVHVQHGKHLVLIGEPGQPARAQRCRHCGMRVRECSDPHADHFAHDVDDGPELVLHYPAPA